MIPIEENKEYIGEITSVSSDGNGVMHIDGFTVFVPQTVSGDKVKVRIEKVKKRFGEGKLTEIISPSDKRCSADCEHFTSCGGCQLRHIKYDEQLIIKRGIIENAMQRIGGFKDFTLDKIVGAENRDRYRNKMIFPVGYKNGKAVCGFYAPSTHDIIPLSDCALGDETNKKIINAALEYINENNVSIYDEKKHSGVIRRIFTRKSFSNGEIMVVISANAEEIPNAESLVKKLTDISDKIVSVILNVNKRRGGFVITADNITLWGKDRISDILCGIEFSISPQSFFQINPAQTEKLYKKAIEFADIQSDMSVMDIYCGIGTISLCAARYAKNVIGVEIVEQAINDARENAERNNIKNARFYASSAENIVPVLIDKGETPDIIILDPPRKGSDEATLSAIAKATPKRIVYISCNPSTLARDAAFLAQYGYKITASQGFDLFPHTSHVETVVLMTK